MSDGPYLFDVSLVALAHAGTPVSDPALDYVRRAVAGDVDAVVPHPVLVGAHHTLRNVYRFSNAEASRLLAGFLTPARYTGMSRSPRISCATASTSPVRRTSTAGTATTARSPGARASRRF